MDLLASDNRFRIVDSKYIITLRQAHQIEDDGMQGSLSLSWWSLGQEDNGLKLIKLRANHRGVPVPVFVVLVWLRHFLTGMSSN